MALPFHIPDNAFSVVELRGIAPLLTALGNVSLAAAAVALAGELDAGIKVCHVCGVCVCVCVCEIV